MLKNRPLLTAAIVFGSIGLLLIITSAIIYIDGGKTIYNAIASLLGMPIGKVTTASFCQFGTLFEIAAFALGYKSFTTESSEQ
ncbi:MAG: hypothetical protein IJ192_08765 [Clostridia bacterium]|nr:hypothetical protein [Clostridia bacterium]